MYIADQHVLFIYCQLVTISFQFQTFPTFSFLFMLIQSFFHVILAKIVLSVPMLICSILAFNSKKCCLSSKTTFCLFSISKHQPILSLFLISYALSLLNCRLFYQLPIPTQSCYNFLPSASLLTLILSVSSRSISNIWQKFGSPIELSSPSPC